jgi:hypothetical protein
MRGAECSRRDRLFRQLCPTEALWSLTWWWRGIGLHRIAFTISVLLWVVSTELWSGRVHGALSCRKQKLNNLSFRPTIQLHQPYSVISQWR